MPNLQKLSLDSCAIGPSGAAVLADVLACWRAPHLSTLLLQNNAIGDAGLETLAAAFRGGACEALEVRTLPRAQWGVGEERGWEEGK